MKPRKCTMLFLALLVLLSNTGLAFNVHFCEGVIASVTSAYNSGESCNKVPEPAEKKCCGTTQEKKHDECCKNKLVNLKEKPDDVIVKSFSFQFEAPLPVVHQLSPVFEVAAVSQHAAKITYFSEVHSPPLFKLYSRYILYA